MTRNPSMPPLTPSAAAHAERIARGGRQQPARSEAGTKTTAERYAERILPGYQADEELREQARLRELEARGIITPDVEDYDDEEFEEAPDEEERSPTTAELYAAQERKRIKASRPASREAWHSARPAGGYVA